MTQPHYPHFKKLHWQGARNVPRTLEKLQQNRKKWKTKLCYQDVFVEKMILSLQNFPSFQKKFHISLKAINNDFYEVKLFTFISFLHISFPFSAPIVFLQFSFLHFIGFSNKNRMEKGIFLSFFAKWMFFWSANMKEFFLNQQ